MSRRLYLMRHGYTVFNQLELMQGWCDSPLTELGLTQALELREHLEQLGVTFTHAYSSPSERAWRSLMIAAPRLGMPSLDKRLREFSCGSLEAARISCNPWPIPRDYFVRFGGECMSDVRARMVEALADIMSRPGHETALVASHGAAVREFFDEWSGNSRIDPATLLGNCGYYAFEYDETTGEFSCFDTWAPQTQPQSPPAILFIKPPESW